MIENAIFLQQQKSKSHRKYIFSPAKQIYNFIPQFRNTNKTQEKKKLYSGQIERRRKRRRTISFGVKDDWFWGATIAIGDDESGFAIGDDESMLRLRSRSARRRRRRVKLNGDVERQSRTDSKSNGEVEVKWRTDRPLSLSLSLSLSLCAGARLPLPRLSLSFPENGNLKVK